MGHTPFGYRIENGTAVIDKPAATKLRQLYKNYLSGMSLSKAAAEAGIPTYHGTAKRLMETAHYLGDAAQHGLQAPARQVLKALRPGGAAVAMLLGVGGDGGCQGMGGHRLHRRRGGQQVGCLTPMG